jgi:hypothetical protein
MEQDLLCTRKWNLGKDTKPRADTQRNRPLGDARGSRNTGWAGANDNPLSTLSHWHVATLWVIEMHKCFQIRGMATEITRILVFIWTQLPFGKHCAFLWVLCWVGWQAWDRAKSLAFVKQSKQPSHFTFLHTLSFNYDFMNLDMTKIIRSILFAYEYLISASARCMNANKYYGWMQR